MKKLFVLLAAVLLSSSGAEAKRQRYVVAHPVCNITMPCEGVAPSPRGVEIARQLKWGSPQQHYTPKVVKREPVRKKVREVSNFGAPSNSLARGVSGLVAPLAAKVSEIQSTCNARVVSAVRHTYIAGTRRMSLHASGQAADVTGDYGCIYQRLQNWPGGYTTDAHRMRHIHISYGGYEMGLRFAHGGGHRKYSRYAKRHKHRYASGYSYLSTSR